MSQEEQTENQFQIQKIYIKDMSFEIPDGSSVFNQDWKPELSVTLNTDIKTLEEKDTYEVVLTVEANVKCNEKEAFKAQVHQAGVFTISNMPKEQLEHTQYAFCSNFLYAYAHEAISDMVLKGGFPQLCLSPVNFEMMYEQRKNEASQ